MPQVRWKAAPDGRYWIDVILGNSHLPVMIDLGLIDPHNRVGFEVEPVVYDRIKQSGGFTLFARRARRDASGRISWFDTGLTTAQLVCPAAHQPVGPAVQVFVASGLAGVPSRVGVVFFHNLIRCQVVWDLDHRTWCMDYP
jgi:hypothetical protein